MVRPITRTAPAARSVARLPVTRQVEISTTRAAAAYSRAAAIFDQQIAAVMGDITLTPEQRQMKVALLRLQQLQAAEQARQWVIEDEQAAAKARRRLLRRQAQRRPRR